MSMLSIQVSEWGSAPKSVHTLPPPTPVDDSEIQVRLVAAGIHQIVRSRASGQHYSTRSAQLPHTLGVDGVGIDTATGKKVYFAALGGRSGSYSQVVNVARADTAELPEGVDAVQAAALMNPVMSSWMALRKRVDFVKEGRAKEWTCFIMGVTSVSGRLAIKVARELGASKVIGAARNEEALKKLGLDSYIVLRDTITDTDFSAAADADVALDYLYGPYMAAFLTGVGSSRRPLTYVQIGSLAGQTAEVPSGLLRQRDVTIRGSGPGAWSPRELGPEMGRMLRVLKGVSMGEVRGVRMEDFEEAWGSRDGRVVIVNEAELA